MLFVRDAPEFSSMANNAHGDMHAKRREINEKLQQTTISLNDFLGQFDAPRQIDFISIDTEGNELSILSTFDFDCFDVRLFCVEHNWTSAEGEIDRIMNFCGYERVHREWSKWDAWYRKR